MPTPKKFYKKPTDSFETKIYNAVKKIPRGKAATYAYIAGACGRPRAWRAVGNILNKNRSRSVPCHRVIRSDRTAGGYAWGAERKINILKKEGIVFLGNKAKGEFIIHHLTARSRS
ncbi:MAG: MGMT family protein [Candidatus Sungbacteria bacterium]|nr:MGMT family protein [Candidatus Sungbacteria bacterium]